MDKNQKIIAIVVIVLAIVGLLGLTYKSQNKTLDTNNSIELDSSSMMQEEVEPVENVTTTGETMELENVLKELDSLEIDESAIDL